LRENEFP